MSVTVAITRHVAPGHDDQMVAWLRAGTELAHRFDGFLGQGWIRPEPGSREWHMLYRFADETSLRAWEESEQRRWWLDTGRGFIDEGEVVKRTGIEGWFDAPKSTDEADFRPAAPPPPRWKQMCAIFCVFYPLSLITNIATAEYLGDTFTPLRVLVGVLFMTPIMTYLALPWITRLLEPWLTGRPRKPR